MMPGVLRIATATLGLTWLGTALPTRRDADYAAIVVFGDSMSDNGNVFRYTNHTWPADPAYFEGHFTNGPVWAETLAAKRSLPLTDYAHAGATTSNSLVPGLSGRNGNISVPSLSDQVERYLASQPREKNLSDFENPPVIQDAPVVQNSLLILWGGSNDVLLRPQTPPDASASVMAALVDRLQGAGGEHVVVVGLPDLSKLPYGSYIDAATQRTISRFVRAYNAQLGEVARRAGVAFVGLEALFESLEYYGKGWQAAGFDAFGFYGSCLVGAYMEEPRQLCADADRRVFWDEYHPSTRTHDLIADRVDEVVKMERP